MNAISVLLSVLSLVFLRGAFYRYQALLQPGLRCPAGGGKRVESRDQAIGMDPRLTAYLALSMSCAIAIVFVMTRYP